MAVRIARSAPGSTPEAAIEEPGRAGARFAPGRAPSLAVQLVDNRLDERLVHVWGIAHRQDFPRPAPFDHDVGIGEDRRRQPSDGAGEGDPIALRVRVEIEEPGPSQAAGKYECG